MLDDTTQYSYSPISGPPVPFKACAHPVAKPPRCGYTTHADFHCRTKHPPSGACQCA